jgi:polyphosphate kinase 2
MAFLHIMSETDNQLLSYQTTLVALQREIIKRRLQVLIVLEGRDASGKDGCAKRVLQYLSPRESRVVALSVPSEIEINQWYFRRHVDQLPQFGELVVFNRSWYNRAGVEHVMGYCSQQQLKEFIELAPLFELLLIRSGFIVLKYYLDISKQEQEARLLERANSPLKRWKFSAVDAVAVEKWDLYSTARDLMLEMTSSNHCRWNVIHADNKKLARLALLHSIILVLSDKLGIEYEDTSLDINHSLLTFQVTDRNSLSQLAR